MKRKLSRLAVAAVFAGSAGSVIAQYSATAGGYKLATRWAKSYPFASRIRVAPRLGGGLYVVYGQSYMADSTMQALDRAGQPVWSAPPGPYHSLAGDSQGNLFVGGFRSRPDQEADIELYKFNSAGSVLRHVSDFVDLSYAGQVAKVVDVAVDELGRPYFQTTLETSRSDWYRATTANLDLRFVVGDWSTGPGHTFSVDRFGNTYHNAGQSVTKLKPNDTEAWVRRNPYPALIEMVRFDNGVILTMNWERGNEPHGQKLNANGTYLGPLPDGTSLVKLDEQSALMGAWLSGELVKLDSLGRTLWRSQITNFAYPFIYPLGRDPWGYLYALSVNDTQPYMASLVKCSADGKVLWARTMPTYNYYECRAGVVRISPINGDIYYCDEGGQSARLYCLHQAPVGLPDVYSMSKNGSLAADVAANDEYGVDAAYEIVQNPATGTATISSEGVLTYTPPTGFTGVVNLKYVATKPGLQATNPTNVQVLVNP